MKSVFGRIGSNLDKAVTAYHIGGNAMCWHGLKDTTKDADVVFLTEKEAEAFKKALIVSGFIENEIVNLDGGYTNMNTFGIFDEVRETPLNQEFTPGLRVDVFLKRVCGVFGFSEGMKKRSVRGFDSGNLVNMVCAPEDVFLFKSVTSREKDLDDMYSIFKGGLDWRVVEDEFRGQVKGIGRKLGGEYSTVVFGRWKLFSGRFGVKVPISHNNIKK
ncbi:MAG: hypothetical protein KKD39_01440 [Candidatus Altiarchaeota archaeon]|nr:hypothetical protein [Candidatus Altiarchaeota archaeon]